MRIEWAVNKSAVAVARCENCDALLTRQPLKGFGACSECKMIVTTGNTVRVNWEPNGLWSAE